MNTANRHESLDEAREQIPDEQMAPDYSSDPIFLRIRDMFVQALGVDEEEVRMDSKIESDLGAESIDFLDIHYRLEKDFGLNIPRGEIFSVADFIDTLQDEDFFWVDPNGGRDGASYRKLTSSGLGKLMQVKHLDVSKLEGFAEEPRVDAMRDLYTVEATYKFIREKLVEQSHRR